MFSKKQNSCEINCAFPLDKCHYITARAQISLGSPTRPAWWGEEEPRSEQTVSNLIRRLNEVRDDEDRRRRSEGEVSDHRQSKPASLLPNSNDTVDTLSKVFFLKRLVQAVFCTFISISNMIYIMLYQQICSSIMLQSRCTYAIMIQKR